MQWLERCRDWVTRYDPALGKPPGHHYAFVRALSEALPDNAIIVSDTGGNAIMMGHCFRSKKGQRIFSSNGNSPMGFAMCGAIGAWFAQPDRPVICLIGDGGMQLNIQELQTIKRYQVPAKVFILNNGILGNTKAYQIQNNMAQIGCGPDGYDAPNFLAIARAYALPCGQLTSDTIRVALECKGAFIADVVHQDFCDYAPRMVRWDREIQQMEPELPQDEYDANMVRE